MTLKQWESNTWLRPEPTSKKEGACRSGTRGALVQLTGRGRARGGPWCGADLQVANHGSFRERQNLGHFGSIPCQEGLAGPPAAGGSLHPSVEGNEEPFGPGAGLAHQGRIERREQLE